jgi:hypothetical protein
MKKGCKRFTSQCPPKQARIAIFISNKVDFILTLVIGDK